MLGIPASFASSPLNGAFDALEFRRLVPHINHSNSETLAGGTFDSGFQGSMILYTDLAELSKFPYATVWTLVEVHLGWYRILGHS